MNSTVSVLAIVSAFCLPLKLSLTYVLLIPLALWWCVRSRLRLREFISETPPLLFVPLIFFLLSAALSAVFGIRPVYSLLTLGGLFFLTALIPVFCHLARSHAAMSIAISFFLGSSLACLNGILHSGLPLVIPRFFLGPVTESGQLALSIPFALGLMLYLRTSLRPPGTEFAIHKSLSQPRLFMAFGAVNFLCLLCFAFNPERSLPMSAASSTWLLCLLPLVLGGMLCLYFRKNAAASDWANFVFLVCVCLPLLLTELVVNLKRGPWGGVFLSILVYLCPFRRRLILPVVAGAALLLLCVEPVQQRLAQSYDHFFISGGRSIIWSIGLELASTFPLGVGYENSGLLREFSTTIPQQLRHFHSNFLNIVVECGWISLALFIWWIFEALRTAFKQTALRRDYILSAAIGCSLISWQLAGLVEYNFGDSEVLLLAFLLIGILGGLRLPALDASA